MIDYNVEFVNHHDLPGSFFHMDRNDPTLGFAYDASQISGHAFPSDAAVETLPTKSDSPLSPLSALEACQQTLYLRLVLGSHLAQHLRHQLEEQTGYTCTVGISTSKLLSKLVGNVNKPKGQTTLMPPYEPLLVGGSNNVTQFIDRHDIGKIPNIGFKIAEKIRTHVLGRQAAFDAGLIYGGTKEKVLVKDVRLYPDMGSQLLEKLLSAPGMPKSTSAKVWSLINGVDDTEVGYARNVPRQISIEDSYIKLDTTEEVTKELNMLAKSLIKRMRLDLTELETDDDHPPPEDVEANADTTEQLTNTPSARRWLAYPRTLRLSTRQRQPLYPDGTRARTFNRISRSSPMPSFVFSLHKTIEDLAEKLVKETLIPSFRKLHPEVFGWNLSLVNVAATNMAETGTDDKKGNGRDIGRMFRRQEDMLKNWKVRDFDDLPRTNGFNSVSDPSAQVVHGRTENLCDDDGQTKTDDCNDLCSIPADFQTGSEYNLISTQESYSLGTAWDSDEEPLDEGHQCQFCGAKMPEFAMVAHERFHALAD